MKKFTILWIVLIQLITLNLPAQETGNSKVKGVVRDQSNGQVIPAVSIRIKGTTSGIVSDANGSFIIQASSGSIELIFRHVSYREKSMEVLVKSGEELNLGSIVLEATSIGLGEVHIISSYISDRGIPVAVSTISSKTIERQSGNQDYPEILKMTPGVYATKAGGGSGDDRLTIRGFQQENIALLLNGVPVSSMENGLVYWSNWIGLTDATEAIQVQRGLGASKVAMNSVGGTVNIITKATQSSPGGTIRSSLSSYGNQRYIMQFSTGRLKSGTAITFLGSRTRGPGYTDGTYVDGWAYFLSVSHEFNPKHSITLTALGSPERHGQMNFGLSNSDYEKYGNRYNPSWGTYNGKILNLQENFYHKPQINLNHYWNISEKAFLATSAYVSFGTGGGRYTESFNYGPSLWYLRKNNQIDYDAAYQLNNHTDVTELANGNLVSGYSKIILTNYKAEHYWAGILSSLKYKLNSKMELTAGIHVRNFKSRLYEEVDDLMGGNSWIELYAWSISGVAGRNQVKHAGDVINVDNSSLINYGNLFGQIEYKSGLWSSFLASTVSATRYQRKDPFNYVQDPYSQIVNKQGFDVKSGVGRKTGKHGKLYANLGFYSREPYFKFVYVNYSNAVARDLKNEKITAAETGFEYNNGRVTSRVNAYLTQWKDKSLLSRENIQLADSSLTRSLVNGLNALHTGVEWDITVAVRKNLLASACLSVGNWKWQNDVTASIYNDNQVLVDSSRIYTKGLMVGDAPQTQLGLSLNYSFLDNFELDANWVYFDNLYANFDPANRTNESDRSQPFKLPSYSTLDLYLSYDFMLSRMPCSLQACCQNVFDEQAYTRGDDGSGHDLASFTGYKAQGRTFNFSMKLSF
ncbi:MAG: TonB-dependent receptor [Bacteroidales bacterium]|nr:TonB-dependent receptor [Bacteroidales bacterium]